MYHKLFFVFGLCLLSAGLLRAQSQTCEPEVVSILEQVTEDCSELGRNEVCYGNRRIESEIADGEFDFVGQVIAVENLISLQTAPYNEETEEWGIAIFNLQANLPDTLPSQLVTIVVFGDSSLTPHDEVSDAYPYPMQAFSLSTGIGQINCNDLPDGGVLIQNRSNETLELFINDFAVEINSTALFTAEDIDELRIMTLEGVITITDDEGNTVSIPEGFSSTVQQGETFETPQPSEETGNEALPVASLPEAVPQAGEPTTASTGLLQCAGSGLDVTAGSTVILRGGWFLEDLAELVAFSADYRPNFSYDGNFVPHAYRTGPAAAQDGSENDGYRVDWYWEISNISAGTHTATWSTPLGDVSCEIRAN